MINDDNLDAYDEVVFSTVVGLVHISWPLFLKPLPE